MRKAKVSDRPWLLAFHHIEKCGGSSVRRFLEANFAYSFRLDFAEMALNLRGARLPRQHPILAIGHATWGVHELLPRRTCRYVTMLREPFHRMRSDYLFNRARGTFTGSFERFAGRRLNFLCFRLADSDLDLAKERLSTVYDSFGILERFEDSLLLWAGRYAFLELEYVHDNRTIVDDRAPVIGREARERFYELNRKDVELYDFACRLFAERLRRARDSARGPKLQLVGYNEQDALRPAQRNTLHTADLSTALPLPLIAEAEHQMARHADPGRGVEAARRYGAATGYYPPYEKALRAFRRNAELYAFSRDRLRDLARLPGTLHDSAVNVRRRSLFLNMLDSLANDPDLFVDTLWRPLTRLARRVALLGAGDESQSLFDCIRRARAMPEIVAFVELPDATNVRVRGCPSVRLPDITAFRAEAVVVASTWIAQIEAHIAVAKAAGLRVVELYTPLFRLFSGFDGFRIVPQRARRQDLTT